MYKVSRESWQRIILKRTLKPIRYQSSFIWPVITWRYLFYNLRPKTPSFLWKKNTSHLNFVSIGHPKETTSAKLSKPKMTLEVDFLVRNIWTLEFVGWTQGCVHGSWKKKKRNITKRPMPPQIFFFFFNWFKNNSKGLRPWHANALGHRCAKLPRDTDTKTHLGLIFKSRFIYRGYKESITTGLRNFSAYSFVNDLLYDLILLNFVDLIKGYIIGLQKLTLISSWKYFIPNVFVVNEWSE